MNDTATFSVEKISILESRILSFSVSNSVEKPLSIKDIQFYDYKVGATTKMSQDKLIRVLIEIEINSKVEEEELSLGKAISEHVFKIENADDLITIEDQSQIELPNLIGATLVGLSYSTTRGMLTVMGAGTILEKAFLPVINPNTLIQKAIED